MSKIASVDLTLLKRFVSELETGLATADAIRTVEGPIPDYLVEMSKTSGLAASVMQEASMLVGDIQKQMMQLQNPSSSQGDLLDKLFGGSKDPLGGPFGGGNAN